MSYYIANDNDSCFLIHHGVKGQKWGVRRYQNSDGTLTTAGKKRYKEYLNSSSLRKSTNQTTKDDALRMRQKARDAENDKKNAGVTKSKNGDETIKKGTSFGRIAPHDDKGAKKHAYTFLNDITGDVQQYTEQIGMLGDTYDTNYWHGYEATKDIKVAPLKKVASHFLSKYGDAQSKQFFDEFYQKGMIPDDTETSKDEWAKKYGIDMNKKMSAIMDRAVTNDKELDYFRNKGYDAIVDPEDSTGPGRSEYPLIMLNPKKSMKQKWEEELW